MITSTIASTSAAVNNRRATTCAGFGLGLRTQHYGDFLAQKQDLDWLEIITDNFLVDGGKPLVMLDRIRRDYPVAMHGVAMSIGSASGVDVAYLRKVKALADRVQPMWVSDHLCWTGLNAEHLHDLYPLPYTDEAARHVVEQILRAQDVLQRRLVLENVSSYIDFRDSAASEWQFLSYIAQAADCQLLLDVNNVYVSSVNHGCDPQDYLDALPVHRVQQIHLAGHSDCGTHIVDTHDHPVAPAVWRLYAKACQRFGHVATMIERDDAIPPLQDLLDELQVARGIASSALTSSHPQTQALQSCQGTWNSPAATLEQVQQTLVNYMLDRPTAPIASAVDLLRAQPGVYVAQRLEIYHHAYRARLTEVLADSFEKTSRYMGSDAFDAEATAYAVQQPPQSRSLSRYGAEFPEFLAAKYPENPELWELAQLDWDLRTRFDSADAAALSVETAQGLQASLWLTRTRPLHPSVLLRTVTSNVVPIWQAIHADALVPEAQMLPLPKTMVVWRKELQPHFQMLDHDVASFLRHLAADGAIEDVANALAGTDLLPDSQRLGEWLHSWLSEGLLRADDAWLDQVNA